MDCRKKKCNKELMGESLKQKTIKGKILATAFSRSVFKDILDFDDFSRLDYLHKKFELKSENYLQLLKESYSYIRRNFRCEYVYKNELISKLLKENRPKETILVNEFQVGTSKADLVMFNGESKAFEIKTEYDSPQRLIKQLEDYQKVFEKVILVIPENKYQDYVKIVDETVGIMVMVADRQTVRLEMAREAQKNRSPESDTMIGCLRIAEYTYLANAVGESLEDLPGYMQYSHCKKLMRGIEPTALTSLFLHAVKSDRTNISNLKKIPSHLRQMVLSLNLSSKKENQLIEKILTSIK